MSKKYSRTDISDISDISEATPTLPQADIRQVTQNLKYLNQLSSSLYQEMRYKNNILSSGLQNNKKYLKSLHNLQRLT
jgi:hypothetical protein